MLKTLAIGEEDPVQGADSADEPSGARPSAGAQLPGPKSLNIQGPPSEPEGTFARSHDAARAGDEELGAEARAALASAKSALRSQLLASRRAMTSEQRAEAGRLLRDAVLAAPETQMAGVVAAYVSVGTEPDTRGLIFALWKRGTYVLLPLLGGDGDLDWASYEGPDSLAPGPRGLLEPTAPPRGVTAITSADLVLVPALAADRAGHRLGRGGGSYDRALARIGPAILTVAMLHEGELLDQVPVGPQDQLVRSVAIPSEGIIRLR